MVRIDGDYVGEIFGILSDNPTSQDLDFLIEARAIIGNYTASAESQYETNKATRQYNEAVSILSVKADNPKYTQQQVEAKVYLDTAIDRAAENKAKADYAKLKSLLESITEAINGVKFLGRMGG